MEGGYGGGGPHRGVIGGIGGYFGQIGYIPLPDVYSTYPNYMGVSY